MNKMPREVVLPLAQIRAVALMVVAVVAVFLAWFILRDSGTSSKRGRAPAVAASSQSLQSLPAQVGHEVYWAGERAGFTYELTQTSDGRIYIRYLPSGVNVGDSRSDFLTVGTYPVRYAYENLKKLSAKGQPTTNLAHGGIAVPSKVDRRSVYLAYPDSDFQVEVYDPSATRSLALVRSGRIAEIP